MGFVSSIILPLLVLCFGQLMSDSSGQIVERTYSGKIGVNNGMVWGSWGHRDMCPYGTYATGFKYVENALGDGDDTALNGIALRCTKPMGSTKEPQPYSTVQSDAGSWGSWTQNIWCPKGVLQAFQLRVESGQGRGDDTAANNIRFSCTGGVELTGSGMYWGEWGGWSEKCVGAGICGIQTKVESPQGSGDDTALNDVTFYCCD
ncbi:vitelline membrane outer layer protein 1-like [Hemibagrus wyckioides]|uniref:vitelline membrane outer layer protein 1-like n=1 Tax=Hemibagrus wyckioides TaxID=337641 RepID=UPI00266CFC00|nr:vitelline membrane outer layer protein 1-like [Hemibagrus wyckioides]